MPVLVNEIARITDLDGKEHEGRAIGTNLVCIENPEGGYFYGKLLKLVRLETTIICDNPKCEHGEIDAEFHTQPKTIQFTEEGNSSPKFIKEISDVVITSDFTGNKLVYCSIECLSSHARKLNKELKNVQLPSGKGKRTFDESPAFIGGGSITE